MKHGFEAKLCNPPPGLDAEELGRHINIWFDDDDPYLTNLAKQVCFTCPSQAECLSEGLDEPSGVWGGLEEDERCTLSATLAVRGMSL